MKAFRVALAAVALGGSALFAPSCAIAKADAPAVSMSFRTVPWGGGGYIPGFLYHPKKPMLLYARTDVGGAYRYDYKAQKWIPLMEDLRRADADLMGVLALAVDPNDPNKLYAACGLYISDWARKGAILRSNDQGKTWQKFDLPIGVGGNADGRGTGERLVVDPANGNTIYFGSNRDGLWKSTDGGVTFARISAPASSISLLHFDSAGSTLYLGAVDGKGGLYASTDGAQTFSKVAGTPDLIPQRIAQGRDGQMFVTFARGEKPGEINPSNAVFGSVWRRDTEGRWKDISPEKPANGATYAYSGVDVGPDGTLVTATLNKWWPGGEIYLSRDSGMSWMGLHEQVKWHKDEYPWTKMWDNNGWFGGWISDVKINPFNKNELIYQDQGAWVMTNLSNAGTGKPIDIVFPNEEFEESAPTELVVPPAGAELLFAMGDQAGAAYFDLTLPPDEGLFRPVQGSARGIDYAGLKPLYLVRTSDAAKKRGFISNDGGLSWTELQSSIFELPDFPKAPWYESGRIAVSAGGTSLVWGASTGGPHYSKDGGKTWAKSAGFPEIKDRHIRPIADKKLDNVFYVFDPAGRIMISIDGGVSFKPIVTGFKEIAPWEQVRLEVMPTVVRDLWLAAPYGLFHSKYPDKPAKAIDGVNQAWAIGFGAPRKAGDYPTIYMSGKVNDVTGFWMSEDEGKSWSEITNSGRRMELVNLIAADMKKFGVVFVNAPRGGAMVSVPVEAAK